VDELNRLWAHEAIRQLASQYAVLMDSRDLDALVELFVDDVRVSRDVRGRESLKQSFDGMLRGIGVSILNIGTHAITLIDDDHATGVVYCKGEIQDGDRWIHQAIVYTDTYERRDGRWLFVRRNHELFYGAEAPVNPMTLPPADWPASHDGRGTLPERWESWQRFQRGSGN
jgi:ketosteroid isomerase-like protein